MTITELYKELEKANDEGVTRHGVIVYREDNWPVVYPIESRSYKVSSDNRAFESGAISNSIFGYSLDGSDMGVRLDLYMAEVGWKVEDCYMLD